jgi:hypothetical protein
MIGTLFQSLYSSQTGFEASPTDGKIEKKLTCFSVREFTVVICDSDD